MTLRPLRWAREFELLFPESEHGESTTFSPSLDITEEDKGFRIHVELPGLTEKDVDLSFEKDALHIKGEKKGNFEEKNKNYHRVERTYGSFYRTIPFAVEVDDSKIEAQFENGVLNIWLPKAAAALRESRKIMIKAK